ncbi:MAG: adenylate/guanylate cyclase domain-containing protein [Desulfamplus sp.]|nr:adenylate/guanylate cyclase domain-containing protein [Desulfamplus sp.]
MTVTSKHLDLIMTKHNRIANLQVIFLDIEKYSQRRTLTQIEIIDSFTHLLGAALKSTAQKYIEYSQANELNLQHDVIALPTGDGAAVIFSFDGLHDMHLYFAKELLKVTHENNTKNSCEKFNEYGWCNCHPCYNLRIGISEGRGIIFKDLNGNYNAAGSVLNLAARVMGLADRNQIIFTEEAFHQIVDMVDDPHLVDHFTRYDQVSIKHNLKINVYQYKDEKTPFINSAQVEDLMLKQKANTAIKKLSAMGLPIPNGDLPDLDKRVMVDFLDKFCTSMTESFNVISTGKDNTTI